MPKVKFKEKSNQKVSNVKNQKKQLAQGRVLCVFYLFRVAVHVWYVFRLSRFFVMLSTFPFVFFDSFWLCKIRCRGLTIWTIYLILPKQMTKHPFHWAAWAKGNVTMRKLPPASRPPISAREVLGSGPLLLLWAMTQWELQGGKFSGPIHVSTRLQNPFQTHTQTKGAQPMFSMSGKSGGPSYFTKEAHKELDLSHACSLRVSFHRGPSQPTSFSCF